MSELHYLVPPELDGRRLGPVLRSLGVTAGLIKAVKHRGSGFFVEGVPAHTDRPMRAGERIAFSLPPELPTEVVPESVPFAIAYEDEFAAVLDKPAGIAVHPTLNYPGYTLANGWLYHLRQRGIADGVFRPVNRIDKNTSGLVLCAKNSFAAAALAGTAEKRYLALVYGRMPAQAGEIDAPIARRGDSIIGRCVAPDGKPSITRYRVLAESDTFTALLCTMVTGRTHQIRVHMAYLGHPLAGDTLYGGSDAAIGRHALHCAAVRFVHPVSGACITVRSPLPQDMAELCPQAAAALEAADLFL